jgi:hypothetical protein
VPFLWAFRAFWESFLDSLLNLMLSAYVL